jgi:SNF2 family DNA or RNA helicase
MVQRGLYAAKIGFVRIDGSVAAKNRVVATEQLRENPSIRVIILTIACGACG